MSSKGKQSMESKGGGKGSNQSRKNNRRRSARNLSVSNGDMNDVDGKDRPNKRGRDSSKDTSEFGYDDYNQDIYKVSTFCFYSFSLKITNYSVFCSYFVYSINILILCNFFCACLIFNFTCVIWLIVLLCA